MLLLLCLDFYFFLNSYIYLLPAYWSVSFNFPVNRITRSLCCSNCRRRTNAYYHCHKKNSESILERKLWCVRFVIMALLFVNVLYVSRNLDMVSRLQSVNSTLAPHSSPKKMWCFPLMALLLKWALAVVLTPNYLVYFMSISPAL